MTTDDYLRDEETSRRRELVWGMVREPPAPLWGHQEVVTRLGARLSEHVLAHDLGRVAVAPIDVVLDADRALILQPDVVFVSTARLHLIRGQVWGAPDLIVEVLSAGTARRDRTVKLGWYARYGVREAWLVDPRRGGIEVVDLARGGTHTIASSDRLVSTVLPDIVLVPKDVLD